MTEGELIQLTMIGNPSITREEYFDILRRKTAYLFSGCAEIGAILGSASYEQQVALRDYGMNLGVAFQLADDLLDFTADEHSLGKAAGADLIEGKITLPLILLQESSPEMRNLLVRIMRDGVYDEDDRGLISGRLKDLGVLDSVREIARSYVTSARKNLDILPQTEYRLALDEIPNFVIDRNS
jgi:octaprenyl-diphosphate synthase